MGNLSTGLIPPATAWQRLTGCRNGFLLLLLAGAAGFTPAVAQQKEVQEDQQVWVGYLTSARISDGFSLWNDFHHIPGSILVARTGLTRHFANRVDATAGYAHLWLPLAGKIKRHEHRPWAQVALLTPIGKHFALQQRLRWELRYRQKVAGNEIVDGYTFNHRGRIQVALRKNFPQLSFWRMTPSLVLADEFMMNLGKEVTVSHFDQNRVSLMAGIRYNGLLLQAGYMNRFVQSPTPGRYTNTHTLVVWLLHNFDLRKKVQEVSE